jgi:hypothetical protein
LYAHVNEDNHAFVQPFKRIFLALSYMKGSKVNDWVRLMREQTILRVNGAPNNNPPILPVNHRDDEALWDWFTAAYRNAFTDTTKSEDALTRLLAIKMQGNDLDTYIATFDHLRETAQWERDSKGTILLFRRGLNPALANAVINRTIPRPQTFHEWAHAAQVQHANWIETKAVMGTQGSTRNDGFNSPRWRQALGRRNQQRDPNAMDVDAVQVGRGQMSEAERTRLQSERQCFFCKEQGHISRYCPKKSQNRTGNSFNQNRPRPVAARAIDAEAPAEANAATAMDRLTVLKGIHGLGAEERAQLLDDLIMSDNQASPSF